MKCLLQIMIIIAEEEPTSKKRKQGNAALAINRPNDLVDLLTVRKYYIDYLSHLLKLLTHEVPGIQVS